MYDIGDIEFPISVGDTFKTATVAPEQRVKLRRKGIKRTCFGKRHTSTDRMLLRCRDEREAEQNADENGRGDVHVEAKVRYSLRKMLNVRVERLPKAVRSRG